MALPLNIFKTVTHVLGSTSVGIYTAPVGYSGVVLLAQVANTGSTTETVTFSHERTTAGIAVTTEIAKDFPIPEKKIDLKRAFKSDPDFEIDTNISDSKLKFKGRICRFRGLINRNLFEIIQEEDLYDNLYILYCKTILKIL